MDDLISRHTAIDKINERQRKLIYCFGFENDAVKIMDIAKSIISAIPSAQPEPQWIPCSERMPEEYGEYLVTKRIIGWNCEEYDVHDIAYFDDDGFPKADRVIAWMPLPEPYKPNNA